MPTYRYEGTRPFQDNANDRVIETDEPVDLAERYAGDHPEFVEVEGNSDDETPTPEAEEHGSSEADSEGYTCAGNDGECSREVEEEGGFCWQHSD